jgi:hypothetical protein
MVLGRRLLSCAVLAVSGALAQSHSVSIVGTVQSVSGNTVYINSSGGGPNGLVALSTDARTEVWKGREFHDLSPVTAGDRVAARYHADASGNPVIDAMWLNISNISAVITKVTGNTFEVLTNPNADPQSAYRKENKTIEVDVDTTFESSAQEDLIPGRNVQVVGLELGNGAIQATRVTVYDKNRPVRMRSDEAVRRTDGSLR